MSKILDSVVFAIGSNPSDSPDTYNSDLFDATSLPATPVTWGSALPIAAVLMKDGSFSFSQSGQFGPSVPDLYTGAAKGGMLTTNVGPVCSFSIDLKGGGLALPGSSTAGDYSLSPALSQILQGAGIRTKASQAVYYTETRTGGKTIDSTTENSVFYKSCKIWLGDPDVPSAKKNAYFLTGCFFDLSFNFQAGETCSLDVSVFCNSFRRLSYNASGATWPTVDYGTQGTLPPPVLEGAAAVWQPRDASGYTSTYTHGFSESQIAIVNEKLEGYDSNTTQHATVTGSQSSSTFGRTYLAGPNKIVTHSGNWYSEQGSSTGVAPDAGDEGARWFEPRSLMRWRDTPSLFGISFNLGNSTSQGELTNGISFSSPFFAIQGYEWTPQAGSMSLSITGNALGYGSGNTADQQLSITAI